MSEGIERLKDIAEKDPLGHPGLMSIALMDYPQAPAPHLRELYGAVYEALSDDYPNAPKKLMRLYPREHGKSEVGSHVIPAWLALSNPNARILILMESETQARGKLDQCRETIRRIGPDFGVGIKQDSATEFTLHRDIVSDVPTIRAAGFGSSITGGHYDLIIFDDLISWESQRTEARRKKISQQFKDYLNLGSQGQTVYMLLGTRKHPDDLYSEIIANPTWNVRIDKAIQDWSIVENKEFDVVCTWNDGRTDEEFVYAGNRLGEIPQEQTIVQVRPRRDVDTLWPERWPLDTLIMEMLAAMSGDDAEGSLVWKRENQNDADALTGQVLGQEMLHFAEPSDVPDNGRILAGIDLALENDPERAATNDTDYWAIAIVKQTSQGIFVLDVVRRRGLSLNAAVKWAKEVLEPYPDVKLYAESTQAQRWFVETAKDNGLNVVESPSKGKKEDRILAMSSRFESGRVKLVGSQWTPFMTEWAQFPSGDHDDMLDAVEIALRGIFSGQTRRPNITSPVYG